MTRRVRKVWLPGGVATCVTFFVVLGGISATLFINAKSSESILIKVTAMILGICIVLPLYMIIKTIYSRHWVKKRSINLKQYTKSVGVEHFKTDDNYQISDTQWKIMGQNPWAVTNSYAAEKWIYADVCFTRFYRGENERPVAAYNLFASTLQIKLPRKLPHIVFDAKNGRKLSFRRIYLRSQTHSLEGNFDTFFDSYFPDHYSIDTLSFITPEVMEALIAAKKYDIEIFEDTIYMFAPYEAMPGQYEELTKLGEAIYKSIVGNISAYRDDRLSKNEGRKTVSEVGLRLRLKLISTYFFLILSPIVFTLGFVITIASVVSLEFSGVILGIIVGIIGGTMFLGLLDDINREKKRRAVMEATQASYERKIAHLRG